jgi:hypothetical protein
MPDHEDPSITEISARTGGLPVTGPPGDAEHRVVLVVTPTVTRHPWGLVSIPFPLIGTRPWLLTLVR